MGKLKLFLSLALIACFTSSFAQNCMVRVKFTFQNSVNPPVGLSIPTDGLFVNANTQIIHKPQNTIEPGTSTMMEICPTDEDSFGYVSYEFGSSEEVCTATFSFNSNKQTYDISGVCEGSNAKISHEGTAVTFSSS